MALPQVVTKSLVAASANNIALSQSPGGAGALTLNGATVTGGIAILDTARRVLITSGGNDSGKIFTISGFPDDNMNTPISETLAGGNAAAVQSQRDYKRISSIKISAASAGTVIVGTDTVGSSPWQSVNYNFGPSNVAFGCVVTGTVNYTIEYTYDELNNNLAPASPPIPTPWSHPTLNAVAATQDGTLGPAPITGWRLTINSGTGSVTATGIAGGIINQR